MLGSGTARPEEADPEPVLLDPHVLLGAERVRGAQPIAGSKMRGGQETVEEEIHAARPRLVPSADPDCEIPGARFTSDELEHERAGLDTGVAEAQARGEPATTLRVRLAREVTRD